MTREEILTCLYEHTLVGNGPEVLSLTEQGLGMGMEPSTLLFDALIPSLEEVGARFERGDFFVPEMLIAGRAMAGAMERLRPLLADTGVETIGKFLMGTVKGDVHDIGKNLVNIMLEGAGFEVIDLGVQVAPEKFVSAIEACVTRSSSWSAAPPSPRSMPMPSAPTVMPPTPRPRSSGPRTFSPASVPSWVPAHD